MKCDDPACSYCENAQTLVIPFRVRMSHQLHSILRSNHRNVSAYIRNLILEDLHRQGLAQKPVKFSRPARKPSLIPVSSGGMVP